MVKREDETLSTSGAKARTQSTRYAALKGRSSTGSVLWSCLGRFSTVTYFMVKREDETL
jgi:hypothetical protein